MAEVPGTKTLICGLSLTLLARDSSVKYRATVICYNKAGNIMVEAD